MQRTVIDYCRKHVDSRRLLFSEHHRAKTCLRQNSRRDDCCLHAVQYDPLLYSRHNDRDRSVKVGREINAHVRTSGFVDNVMFTHNRRAGKATPIGRILSDSPATAPGCLRLPCLPFSCKFSVSEDFSIVNSNSLVETHVRMRMADHVEELLEVGASEVRRRAKSGEQTAIRDLLEIPLTDVLHTNHSALQ